MLTERETMARYGFARSTLRWLVDQGRFPRACKLGLRVIRYRMSDLLEWEAAQKPAELAAT